MALYPCSFRRLITVEKYAGWCQAPWMMRIVGLVTGILKAVARDLASQSHAYFQAGLIFASDPNPEK